MSETSRSDDVGRRSFLKGVAVGAVGLGLSGGLAPDAMADDKPAPSVPGQVKRRKLGRTGRDVSVVSVGGGALNPRNTAILKTAWDHGINFVDVAANYGRGQAELGVGAWLSGGFQHRDKLFISTKASGFKPPQGSSKQVYDAFKATLTQNLSRMKTDYVDLLMWPHAASETSFLKHQAMREAFQKLRDEGLVRYFGTSSHQNYKQVGEAVVDDGFYDVMLIVLNICTQNPDQGGQPVQKPGAGRRRWGGAVEDTRTFLEKARKKNVGVMAMKVAKDAFLGSGADQLLAAEYPTATPWSRHQKLYAYGAKQPGVSTVVVGMASALHLKQAIAVGSA